MTSGLTTGKISLTKGPQNASCDYFKISVTGKGAHVSKPHLGIDAAYIASQIVVGLQSIVARNTDPLETVVVGVGVIKAGTQYNIVAEHAEIEGTTRSFGPEVRKFTNDRVCLLYTSECKRSPQQFIPAGFPPHDNLQPGTEDSDRIPHHTGPGPF